MSIYLVQTVIKWIKCVVKCCEPVENFHYFRVSVHFLRLLQPDLQSPKSPARGSKNWWVWCKAAGRCAEIFRRRCLKPRCWFASSFDPSFKINPYFKKAKGSPCFNDLDFYIIIYYLYIYMYIYIYIYVFFSQARGTVTFAPGAKKRILFPTKP